MLNKDVYRWEETLTCIASEHNWNSPSQLWVCPVMPCKRACTGICWDLHWNKKLPIRHCFCVLGLARAWTPMKPEGGGIAQ
ncbi:hypothetical protein SKAU_G00205130 [Synaphobranchus kaupii]|uniref:Uncharacterized protein n=1 Tax=Synaphobranchus kaupii TaxID=118154 RepID=A0A9Q1FGA3_SYNKA|nr:hypothetical protein SKAU_G00205130 [Synaphobranchus kaupii]